MLCSNTYTTHLSPTNTQTRKEERKRIFLFKFYASRKHNYEYTTELAKVRNAEAQQLRGRAALAADPGSVSGTHMAAHSPLYLQF